MVGGSSIIAGILIALLMGRPSCYAQDLNVDSLRRVAAADLKRSDSLRAVWDVEWKRSDSLRIESMVIRMRSDSLKRVAQSYLAQIAQHDIELIDTSASKLDSKIDSATVQAHKVAVRSIRRPSVPSGKTYSDTLTSLVMRVRPDTGAASFYAEQFHGRKTASGETFNMHDRTCAHRWLPFNTRLKVTNLANGKTVVVRVTDRGPFKHSRVIDLSKQAAKDLDMIRTGVARVAVEVYAQPQDP
jgi:rare lipoprotein A